MTKSSHPASRRFLFRSVFSSILAVLTVLGCGGEGSTTAALPSAQSLTACWQAWSSSAVYTGGAQVSYNGQNYQAAYWTQGNNPATSSGPQGSGQPWIPEGTCGGGTSTTLAAGTYTFGALASPGKCLDVASAGTADGTNIQEWTCNGTGAQSFSVRDAGNGNVTLVNTNSNKCVDVSGSGTADGTNVQLWTCNGTGAQSFSVHDAGNGNVTLVNTNSNKCVDVSASGTADGTNVQLWTCNGTNAQSWKPTPASTPPPPPPSGGGLFAPYADLGNAEGQNIVADARTAGLKTVTLAFLVDGGCVASWGGLGGSVGGATFWNGTRVADAVNGLIGEGVQVIISWGGAAGSVQSSCNNAASLQAMYQSVFNTYPNIIGQDFDIEGGVDVNLVAQALAGLKRANPNKLISLTLPVMPTGLVTAGLNLVNACHSAGFHPDTINVMTMDYGSASDNGGQMGLDAKLAAQATHNQTGDNIGITPDLGVNDTSTEIFQLSDAQDVVSFAKGTSYVNRLAFWSIARDNGSCAGQSYSSSTCSGISQSQFQFCSIFEGY
jgi:hypothetical protein